MRSHSTLHRSRRAARRSARLTARPAPRSATIRCARSRALRPVVRLRLAGAALVAAGFVACGGEPETAPPTEAATPVEPTPISGIYDVRGSTVPVAGGDARKIAGTVILRQDGDQYSATFKLDTTFPGTAEPLAAEVIGRGEGRVSGRTLTGSTQTQLVVSTVPGVDTQFAFIPRIVGARIVSSSITEIADDGTVVIELENRPAEGEDYEPTRTQLKGIRVADTDSHRPDVAAK